MASRAPRLQLARRAATQVLRDHCFDSLPIDPFAIAKASDILVQPIPNEQPGVSGMLIRVGETFGILYARHVPSLGFQRFSVAHELGHYFLDDHVFQLVPGAAPHLSRANFASGDPFETEADMFAAALLMPSVPFIKAMQSMEEGLPTVLGMAQLCQISLTSTALSYARHTRCAIAIIQAHAGVVEFCAVSDALKAEPLGWLKRGDPVPATSLTASFIADPRNVEDRRADRSSGTLSEWFSKARTHRVIEDVIGLGRFARSLTILVCPHLTLVSDGIESEDDEEQDLEERWTPRFAYGR